MKTIILTEPRLWTRRITEVTLVVCLLVAGWTGHSLWRALVDLDRSYAIAERVG